VSARRSCGELAILLHTHMPYVEGFGTWPFGEEWLWEAMVGCYLPLVTLLQSGAPVTLSVTPVLADQLGADGVGDRFRAFITGVRRHTHRIDIDGCRASGEPVLADELERAAQDYERALVAFDALGADLLGALSAHVRWTSSATHAVLPLLATEAGVRLQVEAGVAAHRSRSPLPWRGGFWLPECAHAGWLDPLLSQAGVHSTCVELTDLLGMGSPAHLGPFRSPDGPLLMPIDRATIDLVWGRDGYPAHGSYRDYHHRTVHDHRPWSNAGAPYDAPAARAQARAHAADFVARVIERLRAARAHRADPGLVVCALDTELLGHWWYEGMTWLAEVVEEAQRAGLVLTRLDEALATRRPEPVPPGLGVSTWGEPRDLSTWDGPPVADLAWTAREAELRVLAHERPSAHAVRELLALQSSDWAFMVTRGLAGPYPHRRAAGHRRALDEALGSIGCHASVEARNLAVHAAAASLLAP